MGVRLSTRCVQRTDADEIQLYKVFLNTTLTNFLACRLGSNKNSRLRMQTRKARNSCQSARGRYHVRVELS